MLAHKYKFYVLCTSATILDTILIFFFEHQFLDIKFSLLGDRSGT